MAYQPGPTYLVQRVIYGASPAPFGLTDANLTWISSPITMRIGQATTGGGGTTVLGAVNVDGIVRVRDGAVCYGGATPGNARGAGSVDFQDSRSAATQVASGANSLLVKGTASGSRSVCAGNASNRGIAAGDDSVFLAVTSSATATASGRGASVLIGDSFVDSSATANFARVSKSGTASALHATAVGAGFPISAVASAQYAISAAQPDTGTFNGQFTLSSRSSSAYCLGEGAVTSFAAPDGTFLAVAQANMAGFCSHLAHWVGATSDTVTGTELFINVSQRITPLSFTSSVYLWGEAYCDGDGSVSSWSCFVWASTTAILASTGFGVSTVTDSATPPTLSVSISGGTLRLTGIAGQATNTRFSIFGVVMR